MNISGKIVIPGFVDTHHHLWQSLSKTLESNNGLATYFYLFGETGPAETHFTSDDCYISQLAGALESLECMSNDYTGPCPRLMVR
jgi:cytosine/adenosine deaminase-related metal-dependent hydrolase